MRFPSKVTPYGQSIISKLPIIMSELEKHDRSIVELYDKVGRRMDGPDEFVQAMDCLYYLGAIDIFPGGDVIHYVTRSVL